MAAGGGTQIRLSLDELMRKHEVDTLSAGCKGELDGVVVDNIFAALVDHAVVGAVLQINQVTVTKFHTKLLPSLIFRAAHPKYYLDVAVVVELHGTRHQVNLELDELFQLEHSDQAKVPALEVIVKQGILVHLVI